MSADQCPICLDSLDVKEIMQTKVCSHKFHKDCLVEWLQKGHEECPMCRTRGIKNPQKRESGINSPPISNWKKNALMALASVGIILGGGTLVNNYLSGNSKNVIKLESNFNRHVANREHDPINYNTTPIIANIPALPPLVRQTKFQHLERKRALRQHEQRERAIKEQMDRLQADRLETQVFNKIQTQFKTYDLIIDKQQAKIAITKLKQLKLILENHISSIKHREHQKENQLLNKITTKIESLLKILVPRRR